jgi:hypothetical protein
LVAIEAVEHQWMRLVLAVALLIAMLTVRPRRRCGSSRARRRNELSRSARPGAALPPLVVLRRCSGKWVLTGLRPDAKSRSERDVIVA